MLRLQRKVSESERSNFKYISIAHLKLEQTITLCDETLTIHLSLPTSFNSVRANLQVRVCFRSSASILDNSLVHSSPTPSAHLFPSPTLSLFDCLQRRARVSLFPRPIRHSSRLSLSLTLSPDFRKRGTENALANVTCLHTTSNSYLCVCVFV